MITEPFEHMLFEGGKTNSLGRVNEVIAIVLTDNRLLSELYGCMKHPNAWIRMRAADAFEKVCRVHPEWIEPYIDDIQTDFSDSDQQPSIKWHMAEIYRHVSLNNSQLKRAIAWLETQLRTTDVDWIVAANCMATLASFTKKNMYATKDLQNLLHIQKSHASKSVVRKATTLSLEFA